MKRLHVHIGVEDLDDSIRFYTTLFGAEPDVRKPDYAKWLLEDPRVNFAMSTRRKSPGLDHLGFQVETPEELAALAGTLKDAGKAVVEQTDAACCYARSDKAWVVDPQGIAWETFLTHGDITRYGEDVVSNDELAERAGAACC